MSVDQSNGATALTTEVVRVELDRILAELGVEEEKINVDARLREDFELDSTEMVQVSLELGRVAGVKVALEEGGDLTVGQVCARVVTLVNQSGEQS